MPLPFSRVAVAAVSLVLAGAGWAFAQPSTPKLVFLGPAKVVETDAAGAGARVLVEEERRGFNDGVDYEPRGRHIYWTNMGRPGADDGTIQRADLDGRNVTTIVPAGGAFTPKQLKIDQAGGKLYWADREGMRIMRANLDGSNIEVLVQTGAGEEDRKDERMWCVGIALDVARGHIYWTQKGGDDAGQGVIKRAGLNIPAGQTAAGRTDIEVLFSALPEPIDLDLDLTRRLIYWTDRGDNTVNRAPMDPPRGADPARRSDRQVLVRGAGEAIGLTLDLRNDRMFYTSLDGDLSSAKLDGTDARKLLSGQGPLTGIALVE